MVGLSSSFSVSIVLTIYNFGDDAFQGHMKKLDSNPYYTAVEVQVGYLVADSITNAMGSK